MRLLIVFIAFCHLHCHGLGQISNLTSEVLSAGQKIYSAAVDVVQQNSAVLSKALNSECVIAPKECPNENVTFWLYTRDDNNGLKLTDEVLNTLSSSSSSKPWKIIIHGYTKSKDEIPNPQLREAYFKKGEYNLVSVDYSPLAQDQCYIASVSNVPVVANCTAKLIEKLADKKLLDLSQLHVIGFSLGAQIAGTIHEHLKMGQLGRVTGLDPAAPLFDGVVNHHVTTKSASFVDVIHTNALVKGKYLALGHIDFYLNGGSAQPGCRKENRTDSYSTCNHDRSPKYYAESINSDVGFWGIPCTSSIEFSTHGCTTDESHLVIMGEYTPPTARGIYYLQTNDKPPYAKGKVTSYKGHH